MMIQTPLIPRYPLKWMGIPLFHVNHFSPRYSGKLYFVLGQGLGDHVNGFRILIEIQKKFPYALCIVYADRRWEELVQRLERVEIRWYPKAKDILSKEGTNNPYDDARETIRKEIALSKGEAFLAYAHFPMPDRHARQESTLEAAARTVGLILGENARPYLPLLPSDIEWASLYLRKHNLEKGKFAVISPLSWPNKVWGKDSFSELIDHLYRSHGLRTVIVSYPEIGSFTNDGSVCAFDLTLGQLSGILACAGLYVGLDSGPSHMAAFFNIPMVVIYVERNVIPFEVRTLSPRALLVVETFFNALPLPSVETVGGAISYLLNGASFPDCPACGRQMNHVVTSDTNVIRLMCACGLARDMKICGEEKSISNATTISMKNPKLSLESFSQDSITLFWSDFLTGDSFLKLDPKLRNSVNEIIIRLLRESISKESTPLELERLYWEIDPLIFWMKGKGYSPYQCTQANEEIVVIFSNSTHSGRNASSFVLPWGKWKIKMTGGRYLRWYSFIRWADPKILVGIVKSMAELGFSRKERFACSLIAFRAEKSLRSFRWIFKSLF